MWGNSLLGNCLPACSGIIEQVRKIFPSAQVIVGEISNKRFDTSTTQNVEEAIRGYLSASLMEKPSFHSWIRLNDVEIFDPCGADWLRSRGVPIDSWVTFLSATLAEQYGIEYLPVLMNEEDVNRFLQRIEDEQGRVA